MPHVLISFPDSGEAGALTLTWIRKGLRPERLEVRGKPYSKWEAGDAGDPLVELHGALHWNLTTPLHAGEDRTVAKPDFYGEDYERLVALFKENP